MIGGPLRGDPHLTRPAELLDGHRLEGEAGVLAVDLTAGDRGDVLELAQPPVAEPGRLGRHAPEDAVDVVVHQHAQGRSLDGLGDDDQRPRVAHDLVQQRHQLLDLGDLLAAQQDVGVVEHRLETRRVGDEVRREVAVVVLEALDEVDAHPVLGGLLHRDDAGVADGVQGLGQHVADGLVVVRGDRRDAGVVGHGDHGVGDLAQLLDQPADGEVDATLDQHRVAALADRRHALADDGLGDHGRGRRAVADDVVGLDRSFLDQLRAHVLELVAQVDLPSDRDAVVGHHRGAGDLLQDHVAALGAERRLHRLGELVDA